MNIDLLKKLCSINGISGYEKTIGEYIIKEFSSHFDECYRDNLLNVIALKKGHTENPKKVMLFAHLDVAGFIVTHIEENGKLRFSPVGETVINSAVYQKVFFENGTQGIILPEQADEKYTYNSLFVDIGATDKKEAERYISVGDCFSLSLDITMLKGDKLLGASLDNRASCAVLLTAAMNLKDNPDDIYFVFSSQQKAGNRGIKSTAFAISPDFAISIDTSLSICCENPSVRIELGKGPAIKIKDKSVICNEKLTKFVENTANSIGLNLQNEVTNCGTSELAVVQSTCGASVSGLVIPCENPNTSAQIININDLEGLAKLVITLAKSDFSKII